MCGCKDKNKCDNCCNQICSTCKITLPSFTCVIYDGPSISALNISPGDTLESVVRKMALKIIDLQEQIDLL